MSRPRVGWYVHHHGDGHLVRMLAVRPDVDADVVVFSSLPQPAHLPAGTEWVLLPRDDGTERHGDTLLEPVRSDPTAGGRLHWAPLRHRGHRDRLATIAAGAGGLDAFVVDVSAEVTALVRVLGLPTVLFTQPGVRTDPAHRLAFDLATAVICPWPAGLHDTSHIGGDASRIHEVGGISRFAARASRPAIPGSVLVLGGIGERADRPRIWGELLARFPQRRWTSAGYLPGSYVEDPWDLLTEAEVVVSAAGQNSVADVATASRRLVLVPQPRPFDEQATTARALGTRAAVTTLAAWPDTDGLADALASVARHEPEWGDWDTAHGAARAARVIETLLP